MLLFIAMGQTPAQLGIYGSLGECKEAIRSIYVRQNTPQGVQISSHVRATLEAAATKMAEFDMNYMCKPVND